MSEPAQDPTLPERIRDALRADPHGSQMYLDLGARLDRVAAAHVVAGAAAWLSVHGGWNRPWIIGMGEDPRTVAACVTALARQGAQVEGITVARAAFTHLPPDLRPVEHWEWDWWYATQPPARRPGEAVVVDLDPDDARIPTLLELASPDAMARPGDPRISGWWGIEAGAVTTPDRPADGVRSPSVRPTRAAAEDADALVAVAAVTTMRPPIPHLGSVATDPRWRGRGLARDLCARLTRDALDGGAPAVTLGMHAANLTARAVYASLGYTVGHRWASGPLPQTWPAGPAPQSA